MVHQERAEALSKLSNLGAEKSSVMGSQIDGKCRPLTQIDKKERLKATFGDNHVKR